ncbi:MAG: fructosamine kinase family protein [Planctomycetales bacterium]|nr:fructosamine kinase family protein [Planctomycetales bacterium]
MSLVRNHRLAELIATATHTAQREVVRAENCSGGCIHRTQIVELSDGRRFFVKAGPAAGDMFAQEAAGLAALATVGCLRTPAVITAGMLENSQACLVLEAIQSSTPKPHFWQQFGRRFAQLHRTATAVRFGWSGDNYLGSNLQRNAAHETWCRFFAECRLGYQLRLARNNGRGSRELFKLAERLLDKLEDRLGPCSDPPSLLHGDLWSGNFVVDETGEAVLIDPAVYYGQREADLAMPLLFGGFSPDFLAAYQEYWPLTAGWEERVELYKLYHLLNHLNLFGSGYLDSCLEIARRFA